MRRILTRSRRFADPLRRFRRGAVMLALFAGLTFGSAIVAGAQPPRSAEEYQVKAAFLYNFTKYVDWPPSTFANPQDPWVICVFGDDPFGATLDNTLAGETVHDRTMIARRVKNSSDLIGCHVVFLSAAERDRIPEVLSETRDSPVLTVSEAADFASRGGMIGLHVQRDQVHFEVNVEAAERVGLKLSAQLLKIAVNVIGQRAR